MDPASAFALSCGVIQVIQASYGLVTTTKQLYDRGSIEKSALLKDQISQMDHLLSDLDTGRAHVSLDEADQRDYGELLTLAADCDNCAQELLQLLRRFEVSAPHKAWKSLKKSPEIMWRMSTIEKLRDKMETYQELLNSRILATLWTKVNRALTEQREGFRKLDESMEAMAVSFAQSSCSFEDLSNLIRSEGLLTRSQVDRHFQRIEATKLDNAFLESLYFPDLICGQKKIVDAHEKTFQWIFEPSDPTEGSWSDFTNWLVNGSGTYWINGKAGSGKSTLMNFVANDSRFLQLLSRWAGSKHLLVPIFFFWAGDSNLQKSTEGCLRSIIYQILARHRDLIATITPRDSTAISKADPFNVWTEGRLRRALMDLIKACADSFRICLLLDGLDELQGDHRELLRLIKGLTDHVDIKCCFSSRPEKPFEEFNTPNTLKLQDLTRGDIAMYIDAELGKLSQMQELSKTHDGWKKSLKDEISERADGVFLWVHLALNSQINGIRNHDSLETLWDKLHSVPEDVEGIYSGMLGQIDSYYKKEAATYLQTALRLGSYYDSRPSVLNLAIARFGLTHDLRLSPDFKQKHIAQRCQGTYDRIKLTCSGLLEIYDISERREGSFENWLAWKPKRGSSPSSNLKIDWTRKGVRFIHRSAIDFFRLDGKGRQFLESFNPFSMHTKLLKSAIRLARMKLSHVKGNEPYMRYHAGKLLEAAEFEPETKDELETATELFEYFDRTINSFDQRHRDQADFRHWSQRWMFVVNKYPLWNDTAQLPRDLISLAALFNISWYYDTVLMTRHRNADEAEHLAVCLMLSPSRQDHHDALHVVGGLYTWEILKKVAPLIKMGADPDVTIWTHQTSIWQEIAIFLYALKFRVQPASYYDHDQDYPEDAQCLKLLETFLDAGASPTLVFRYKEEPFLNLTYGRDLYHGFDLDMSRLPLVFSGAGYKTQSSTPVSNLRPGITDGAVSPLRLYFKRKGESGMGEGKTIEYVMGDTEVEELYALLRALIDKSRRFFRARHGVAQRICHWVGAIYQEQFPECYDSKDWILNLYLYRSYDSDDSDDSDDSVVGNGSDDVDDDGANISGDAGEISDVDPN